MAHLRALLRLASSNIREYCSRSASLTLHRIYTRTLHSFRPFTPKVGTSWQPNFGIPKEPTSWNTVDSSRPERCAGKDGGMAGPKTSADSY